MKDIPKDIKKKVLDGYVIDEKGNWVTINDKVERERNFMIHLEAGEVLHNGKWTKITDVKKMEKEKQTKIYQTDSLLAIGAYTELEETKNLQNGGTVPSMIPNSSTVPPAPPKTKFGFPMPEAEEETKYLEIKHSTVDYYKNNHRESDPNEYLEETMSFDMKSIIEPGSGNHTSLSNNKAPSRNNTKEIHNVADSWERERKRKQLLFFSVSFTIALFAILGALALAFLL
jgi:hypothetical protein